MSDTVRRQRHVTTIPLWMTLATAAMLLPVALTPLVPAADRYQVLATWGSLAVAAGLLGFAVHVLRRRRVDAEAAHGPGRPRPAPLREHLAAALYVAVNLSPVVLLSLAFPFASARLDSERVAGVPLALVVAASSLTVPWLSQMACHPLYRVVVGAHDKDAAAYSRRFAAAWWGLWLQSLPVMVLGTLPVLWVMHWPLEAYAAYLGLSGLNLAFAMSLVLANALRLRLRWLTGWAVYAVVIALAPQDWWLPPVCAVVSQLVPLRGALLTRPHLGSYLKVLRDMGRGALTGSVLWADKYVLLLAFGTQLDIALTFLAALPGVVAYNYYFVRLGPGFDERVEVLRLAMSSRPHTQTSFYASSVAATMRRSLHLVACIAAVASLVVVLVVARSAPERATYAAVVAVTSFLTTMTTLFCYKLEYLGEAATALVISAAHLAACVLIILTLQNATAAYGVLAVAEIGVFVAALRAFELRWRTPEYALFWRHATRW